MIPAQSLLIDPIRNRIWILTGTERNQVFQRRSMPYGVVAASQRSMSASTVISHPCLHVFYLFFAGHLQLCNLASRSYGFVFAPISDDFGTTSFEISVTYCILSTIGVYERRSAIDYRLVHQCLCVPQTCT